MGNHLSVTASVPAAPAGYSGTATYQYDYAQTANPQLNRSQLTGETSTRITGSGSYAYDGGIGNGAGNPTSFKGTVNSFNSDNQQTGNTYDGNGSPTTYRTKTLTFDPENRMSGYSGSTQTNVYSGDGMRATKAGTRAGKYLYDDNVPVIEFTASNEVSNTFGPDGLVSRHVLGGVTTFYTFDERGNVSQRLTNTGTVSSTDAYDTYGTRSSTVSMQPDPWGYEAEAGYYTDTETGLILCTHRFYDPTTGRWLTRDPIGYDGGINLYGYVGNDPGNGVDPRGTINHTQPPPPQTSTVQQILDFLANIFAPNGSVTPPFGGYGCDDDDAVLRNVYNGPKQSPNYPEGFLRCKNGFGKVKVKNLGLLDLLRKAEAGDWHKIYEDGWDADGNKISIHYFQSRSGKVFDLWVSDGWSNQ